MSHILDSIQSYIRIDGTETPQYLKEMEQSKESYKAIQTKISKMYASLDSEDSWFLECKFTTKNKDKINVN